MADWLWLAVVVDRTYALGPATAGQAARLYERFFPAVTNGSAHAFGERAAGLTPATIQGHLIKHWDDPAAALERPDG